MELRTLGGLAIHAESGPVEGAGSQKRRLALLALVDAAGDRGITRDKLLGYLWADSDLEKGRGALAQALYALRKSLGSEDLFVGSNEVRLNREVLDSDRARFLAALAKGELESAVSHYAGPYLDGFYLTEAGEFELWSEGERSALAHKYVAALQKLAAAAESSGDWLGAVGWWRKLVVVDPLNGQLALGLMRAMAAAGDRAGAVQHAKIYERLVQMELEVPGDAAVQALAEDLKRPAPPPLAPSSSTPSGPPASAPAQHAGSPTTASPSAADPAVPDASSARMTPGPAATESPAVRSPSPSVPVPSSPPLRRSLAEQLSTAEVVAVAMSRLKTSRSAHDSYAGVDRARDRGRNRAPTRPGQRTLAAMQAQFPRDRYVIVRELGSGGMATVFLARDVRHDRDVAIKVLHQDLGAALGPERFLAEIKTTARLQHPHILPLLDSGTVGDGQDALLFYVMPYVAGETLRDRLTREKQLPLDDAMRIAREVADALAYAHGQKIVHRDIKPENILLQGDHALVADFGIALAAETAGADRTTQAGLSLGTPEYMAPEQAMGKGTVDHRADLYALGAVTYEMLTGDPPFTGSTPQSVVAKMLTERPVPPRTVRDTVPPGIEAAVLTALAKLPADRFSQAIDFTRALSDVPGYTSGARAVPATKRPRRGPWIAGAVAAVALVAVIVGLLMRRGPEPLVMGAVTHITRSPDTLNFDAAISPDGRFVAYASGDVGQMRLYVRQVSGSTPVSIATGLSGDHRWPRWSPDGSRLAFVANEGIHVIPALGGAPRLVVSLGRIGGQPAWSPDGTQLAYSDSGGISTIPVAGGASRRVVHTIEAHSPSWSPDGKRIAYAVENLVFAASAGYGNAAPSSIWTVSATGGDSVAVTDASYLNAAPVWWPGGGAVLFVSDRDGSRDVYRQVVKRNGQPSGQVERVTSGLNVFTFTLTHEGSAMAYSTLQLRSNIWMAPIAASGMTPPSAAHQVTTEKQSIEGIALSHDGKWLAYDSNRNGNLDIFKIAFNGTSATGDAVALTTSSAPDYEPRWSPNDDQLVFYSRRFGTRDLFTVNADGRGEARITDLPGNEYYPDWSPDGQRISFSSQVTYAWDVFVTSRSAEGKPGWSTPVRLGTAAPTVDVRWSPDGRSLALVNDGSLALFPVGGGPLRTLVDGRTLAEVITFVAWGRDPSRVFFQTRDSGGVYSYWRVSTAGGPPQRLLRLDEPRHRTRRVEFETDGANLFFTLVDDEADVAVVSLNPRAP